MDISESMDGGAEGGIECPDFNWKIIVVGHQRVGKTSITNRYVHDMFNDNEKSTRTVQISKKNVPIQDSEKFVQIHIWDTLGQEKFMAMAPLFFRKAIGAILVYDVTKKESFDQLDIWLQQLSNNIDSRVIIMLVGNKCDLPNREVPYNVAMMFAKERNMGYLEVSAKTGANIFNTFNCLIRGTTFKQY